jgi:hypothetical protein
LRNVRFRALRREVRSASPSDENVRKRKCSLQIACVSLETSHEVGDAVTVDGARGARFVLRAALSLLVVICIYAVHWVCTYLAAVALVGADDPSFECWGRTIHSGQYSGYCTAAWGGWSFAMYLPELALLVPGVAGFATRSLRVWKWSPGGAAASILVFLIVVLSTHLWTINQMPVVWPAFR